ncbi:MAG: 50S ribosomal protein L28 [Patescibacteria group bacterium]|nr:50S ribosomal protein L28 [Patescibacteria group bacterium]MCL5432209.1 50S ribosomal protein L28 [Patescibacteria group bacterium]
MTTCDICGKGLMHGNLIRHTHTGQWMKRATKNPRLFRPNLHNGKVLIGGVVKNVRACASCLAQYGVKYQLGIKP